LPDVRDRSLAFLVPGDLRSATGGYGYDRRIIAGLRNLGWRVGVHELDASFPLPTAAALAHAEAVFAGIPDDGLAIVDGLAFGAMRAVVAHHGERIRLVALVHHPLAAETGLSQATARELQESERASLRWARHVVVTSEATARALADYDVDAARISVVVPGTDEAPLASGSGTGATQLLCVATLTPRKGYDLLIDSLAALALLPWKLTCVGSLTRSPETVAELRQQLRRAALEERVALVGELTGDALEAVFQSADLFALATRHEGYGMVIAEAIARGIPVISTKTGAIPELVGDDAGLLVAPGDGVAFREALARVLRDPTLLAALRDGARRARDHLPRWPRSCEKLSDVLDRMRQP
jgi:glycosyltransferase involved in cell wall biosynthesis